MSSTFSLCIMHIGDVQVQPPNLLLQMVMVVTTPIVVAQICMYPTHSLGIMHIIGVQGTTLSLSSSCWVLSWLFPCVELPFLFDLALIQSNGQSPVSFQLFSWQLPSFLLYHQITSSLFCLYFDLGSLLRDLPCNILDTFLRIKRLVHHTKMSRSATTRFRNRF